MFFEITLFLIIFLTTAIGAPLGRPPGFPSGPNGEEEGWYALYFAQFLA